MHARTSFPDFVAVCDALSFFTPATAAVIASSSNVRPAVVRRLLSQMVAAGNVERRGNSYRIEHAQPWPSRFGRAGGAA